MPKLQLKAQRMTPAQAPGFYRYKVGDIEVTAINDGFAKRPLEGFVKTPICAQVQEAMKEAFLPTDALPITFNTLVLKQDGRLTLIDTGNGDMRRADLRHLDGELQGRGLRPGAGRHGRVQPFPRRPHQRLPPQGRHGRFPKAEVLVPAAEWDFWMDDARMAQAPDGHEGRLPGRPPCLRADRQGREALRGGQGDRARPDGDRGSRPYARPHGLHALVRQRRLMIMSDVTNHPALFVRNPDWSAVFDMDADQARATRRQMLDMAATERAQVAFYHAPFPATGYIARDGNGFELVPVQWSSAI